MTAETYVSVDVETDGPIPGPCSMLSIGAAAFRADGHMIGTHQANLELLEGATPDVDTMLFWDRHRREYEATRQNTKTPADAINQFVAWVEKLPGRPVFVAYPAGFDFTFTYWYMIRFAGRSPFSFSALDIKTYAMAKLGLPYRESVKKNMPSSWFSSSPHPHVAVEDAIEQGRLFMNMLKARAR